MNKVSIIVPVYNVEKYLSRCIDSILRQTYSNIEIILVDDGSTDSSGKMCDEYEKKDQRIRVIHKKNGGLSDARNAGLIHSTGSYIGFVDSDDMIREDMYELLLRELQATNADFIKSNFIQFNDSTQIHSEIKANQTAIFTPEEAMYDFMNTEYSGTKQMKSSVWDGLYKREIFFEGNNLKVKFPVGKINEDTYVFPELVYRAEKIAHVDSGLYYYYVREDSIIHSGLTIREINSYDLWNHVDELITPHTKAFKEICAFNSATRCIRLLNAIYHSEYKKEYFNQINSFLLDQKPNYLKYISDKSVINSLKIIKSYKIYLIMKRLFRNKFY